VASELLYLLSLFFFVFTNGIPMGQMTMELQAGFPNFTCCMVWPYNKSPANKNEKKKDISTFMTLLEILVLISFQY
jgi:hypothetical protein